MGKKIPQRWKSRAAGVISGDHFKHSVMQRYAFPLKPPNYLPKKILPQQIIDKPWLVGQCVEERQQVVVYLYANKLDRCTCTLLRSLDVSSIILHIRDFLLVLHLLAKGCTDRCYTPSGSFVACHPSCRSYRDIQGKARSCIRGFSSKSPIFQPLSCRSGRWYNLLPKLGYAQKQTLLPVFFFLSLSIWLPSTYK